MTASNRLVAIVLVVVLAGASAFAVLVDSESPPPSRIVRPSPATSALYVSGDTLLRLDLDSGDVRSIGRTPTSDVFASNSSSWIAYVVSGDGAQGGEDFLAEPVLRTLDPETGASNEIGPGFNPLWHPTAPRFAYLHPIVKRQCSGESCRGLFEVVVFDADTQKSAVLTQPGRFNLLAWSGERVLIANESDLSTTLSLGESRGDVERLDLAPSELWDASPDGRWLLQTASDSATLVDLDSGRERGLAIDQGVLADGAWSPDSEHIVAGVLNEARTKTHAVLIDVSTGDVRAITDELAGILGVTWTSDASQFGFLTFVGGSNRTELNLCSVKDILCEVVGPPLRQTILLRLE